MKPISPNKIQTFLLMLLFFLVGSLLYAVSINTFTAPNNIAPGGFTGIATMLNYLFELPIGATIVAMNLPFFIWGALELGKNFLVKVVIGTILTSLAIDATAPYLPVYQGDMMLTCILADSWAEPVWR